MPNKSLIALAGRVEAAGGADRELAKDIFRAVRPELVPVVTPGGRYGWKEDRAGWWQLTGEDTRTPVKTIYPPQWLTSLDAAMTLADGLEQFGGAAGMLRWAMDSMSCLPRPISQIPAREYAELLARYFTAACLRALAKKDD